MKKLATPLVAALVTIASFAPAVDAKGLTRVRFAKGAKCGSWTGSMVGRRDFLLRVVGTRRITVTGLAKGSIADVSADGEPFPMVEQIAPNSWEFTFLGYEGSDVQVTVWPLAARGTVRFCAYPA